MTQCGLEVMYQGRVHRSKAVGQLSSTFWMCLGSASVVMGFPPLPPSKADGSRVEDRHQRDHFIYLYRAYGIWPVGFGFWYSTVWDGSFTPWPLLPVLLFARSTSDRCVAVGIVAGIWIHPTRLSGLKSVLSAIYHITVPRA